MNTEIIFIVEEDPDGGFTAHAVGQSIFSQADSPEELRENVRNAVRCHFEGQERSDGHSMLVGGDDSH